MLILGNRPDLCLELLIELVLNLGCRAECWGIDAKNVGWSRRGGEAKGEDTCDMPEDGASMVDRREFRTAKPTP